MRCFSRKHFFQFGCGAALNFRTTVTRVVIVAVQRPLHFIAIHHLGEMAIQQRRRLRQFPMHAAARRQSEQIRATIRARFHYQRTRVHEIGAKNEKFFDLRVYGVADGVRHSVRKPVILHAVDDFLNRIRNRSGILGVHFAGDYGGALGFQALAPRRIPVLHDLEVIH